MEVAVKGKSPSYLHLFPHSSAGDRGGFSKPGGKLTSITLVSPFLKVFEQMFGVLMCLTLWYEEEKRLIYMNTSENLGDFFFFFQCLRPFLWGTWYIIQSLIMV